MTGAPQRVRRVYLPAGPADIATLATDSAMLPVHGRGFAVTAVVRAAFPHEDEAELEYDALCVAAESAATRDSSEGRPGRAIVVAADVPADQLTDVVDPDATAGVLEPSDAYAVTLSSALPASQVVSIHLQQDPQDLESELLWYDASELPVLAAQFG